MESDSLDAINFTTGYQHEPSDLLGLLEIISHMQATKHQFQSHWKRQKHACQLACITSEYQHPPTVLVGLLEIISYMQAANLLFQSHGKRQKYACQLACIIC